MYFEGHLHQRLSFFGVNFQTEDYKETQYIVVAFGNLKVRITCQKGTGPQWCPSADIVWKS
jgi:hypothetical protein